MSMSTENLPDAGDEQEPVVPTILPPAPVQAPSEKEGLQELVYPSYRAVVTAHFPDRETGTQAREQLMALGSYNLAIQWFDGQAEDIPEERREEAEDDTALLIHLEDAQHGEEVIRICEAAGATKTKYYPARNVARESNRPTNTNRNRAEDA